MKRALFVVAIVVAIGGAAALRVVLAGRAALAEGDDAMAKRRPLDAIAAWEAAARWYLPGAPHVDEAYERLTKLAAGDRLAAPLAWRSIRSAALATRSLWTPHAEDLAAANAALAARSADDVEGSLASGPDNADKRAWHLATLEREPYPSGPFAVLAVLGIACSLAGIAWVIVRGLDRAGRLVRTPALVGAATTVIGLAAWAAGLYNA